MNNDRALCPICKNKLTEHSELQDKICNMIIIKQFAIIICTADVIAER